MNVSKQVTPLLRHNISKLVLSGVISVEATHVCYTVKYFIYPLSPVNIHSFTALWISVFFCTLFTSVSEEA